MCVCRNVVSFGNKLTTRPKLKRWLFARSFGRSFVRSVIVLANVLQLKDISRMVSVCYPQVSCIVNRKMYNAIHSFIYYSLSVDSRVTTVGRIESYWMHNSDAIGCRMRENWMQKVCCVSLTRTTTATTTTRYIVDVSTADRVSTVAVNGMEKPAHGEANADQLATIKLNYTY